MRTCDTEADRCGRVFKDEAAYDTGQAGDDRPSVGIERGKALSPRRQGRLPAARWPGHQELAGGQRGESGPNAAPIAG